MPDQAAQHVNLECVADTFRPLQSHAVRWLDVATDNPQALSLYTSCGFRQTEAYDYHDVPLAETEKSMP